ncbi:MAG: hypothetical protein RML38_04800 [Bacteroidia bacterium]|nr:hypothetical protein [Bacteroidia bacterium]
MKHIKAGIKNVNFFILLLFTACLLCSVFGYPVLTILFGVGVQLVRLWVGQPVLTAISFLQNYA